MAPIASTTRRETLSADQTRQIGARLGAWACAGDIVCLVGGLGAGKTTFTQGIGIGLGLEDSAVSSPTFTLVAEHFDGRLPLYHLDVYRLETAGDLYHLGFEDYLRRADGLIVIEWADKVAEGLPEDRLEITFEEDAGNAETRILLFKSCGPRSLQLLQDALAKK
jgi:tRNA threonylcarbamoyladenosine biosynthesis protein TsaE